MPGTRTRIRSREDRMAKKILFVGAGAIGSYIGSFLSRAGHDVTLVDPWAEQVEAIRKKGISVTGPHDPFEAHPKAFHLNESQRMPRDFDLGFVAMKVYDSAWAAQLAPRHLKREGYIVASENCWPDPIVASVAGASRSLGLVMSKIGVAGWKPGQVERGGETGPGQGARRVPRGRARRAHHGAREGSRRDAIGRRRLSGHRESLGRALGQALRQRHGESCPGHVRARVLRHRLERGGPRDHHSSCVGVRPRRARARLSRA